MLPDNAIKTVLLENKNLGFVKCISNSMSESKSKTLKTNQPKQHEFYTI